jgi:hypothetical protein
MKVALGTFRLALAVWLCLGTQVHIVLDHTATAPDAVHHADTPHHESPRDALAFVPQDDHLCCYHTPRHHHHDDGAPHAYISEALSPVCAKRILSLTQMDFIANPCDDVPMLRPAGMASGVPSHTRMESSDTPARLRAPPLLQESFLNA